VNEPSTAKYAGNAAFLVYLDVERSLLNSVVEAMPFLSCRAVATPLKRRARSSNREENLVPLKADAFPASQKRD
jgi:hypothetical protein